MKPTPRRKWYLTTGRSFHEMVLDPIPQSLPVHFFGSRPQPPPLDVRQGLHLRCSFVYTSLHQCVSWLESLSFIRDSFVVPPKLGRSGRQGSGIFFLCTITIYINKLSTAQQCQVYTHFPMNQMSFVTMAKIIKKKGFVERRVWVSKTTPFATTGGLYFTTLSETCVAHILFLDVHPSWARTKPSLRRASKAFATSSIQSRSMSGKKKKSSRKDSWCQDYSLLLRRARFEKVTVSPRKVALCKKGAKITFIWDSRGERIRSPDACKTPPFHRAAWLPHPSSKQPERGMFVHSISAPPCSTLELYGHE